MQYRLFKYEVLDLLYLALFLATPLFFSLGRKLVVSDYRLDKIPFEFLGWTLFMLCILEIALLLVGSWGCFKDRIMKGLWAGFVCAYLALYSVFRQHSTRVKFDKPNPQIEPATLECDDECQKANFYGQKTAMILWHVSEVFIPLFISVQIIYSLRWRIANRISLCIQKPKIIHRN